MNVHGHCEKQCEKKNANDPRRASFEETTDTDFFNSRRPKTLSSVSLFVCDLAWLT